MSHRRALILNGLCLLIFLAGCKREPKLEFGDVQGTVRINGQPKAGLVLRFSPDREKGNGLPAFASGKSDEQGKYALHYEFQGHEGTGAPVGWHRITVFDSTIPIPPQGTEPKPSSVPQAYGNAATTPLLKEVKPGPQTIDLDITNK
jgi:hypothetical protein